MAKALRIAGAMQGDERFLAWSERVKKWGQGGVLDCYGHECKRLEYLASLVTKNYWS
jgi:hypothetical protein